MHFALKFHTIYFTDNHIFNSFDGFKKKQSSLFMEHDFVDKTILVVEDEEDSRYLFEKTLKRTRADVLYVNNGVAAVNMIKCKPNIDIVLMDIRLPLMDGLMATSLIKGLHPNMPVIIQTAYEMIYARDEAIKCGCDEFISKPIHSRTLLSLLEKHLNH